MDTFRISKFKWTKRMAAGVASLLILSCGNDHESGTGHLFETEFEKNYRAVAQQKTAIQHHLTELTALKKSNFDAYRSIAFTWHLAALETCQPTTRGQQFTALKSGYQQILEANQPSTLEPIPIDNETRECIQKFFTRNWEKINAMIRLN